MGIVDWFITIEIYQTLGSLKIDMVHFQPLERFILFRRRTLGKDMG